MRFDHKMATRNPQATYSTLQDCTGFQLYTRQHGVIDFAAGKLKRMFERERDAAKKLRLAVMYDDYLSGNIAVGFSKGEPVHISVTKHV